MKQVAARDLKSCSSGSAGSSPAAGTKILENRVSKSSVDYTELAGLRIALSNLEIVDITYRDETWISVIDWIKKRINELEKK